MGEFRNWKKGSDASLALDFLNLHRLKFIHSSSSRVTQPVFTVATLEHLAICQ